MSFLLSFLLSSFPLHCTEYKVADIIRSLAGGILMLMLPECLISDAFQG